MKKLTIHICTTETGPCKLKNSLVVSTVAAVSILLSSTVYAKYEKVTVNDQNIDVGVFEAFAIQGLQDSDYCTPNTEAYVISKVVERVLIKDHARSLSLSGRSQHYLDAEAQMQSAVATLPSNASDEEKAQMSLWLLVAESDGYIELLTEEDAIQNTEDMYLNLLALNDPLIVNVPTVQTRLLEFETYDNAESWKKQLANGKPFDDAAIELGKNRNYGGTRWNLAMLALIRIML